jgi:LPS O-antigen subunit length determinant protein (WzzB/FepE family)
MSKERTSTQINEDLTVLLPLQKKLQGRVEFLENLVSTYTSDRVMELCQADNLAIAREKLLNVKEELHFVTRRVTQLQEELAFAERGKISGKKFGF